MFLLHSCFLFLPISSIIPPFRHSVHPILFVLSYNSYFSLFAKPHTHPYMIEIFFLPSKQSALSFPHPFFIPCYTVSIAQLTLLSFHFSSLVRYFSFPIPFLTFLYVHYVRVLFSTIFFVIVYPIASITPCILPFLLSLVHPFLSNSELSTLSHNFLLGIVHVVCYFGPPLTAPSGKFSVILHPSFLELLE